MGGNWVWVYSHNWGFEPVSPARHNWGLKNLFHLLAYSDMEAATHDTGQHWVHPSDGAFVLLLDAVLALIIVYGFPMTRINQVAVEVRNLQDL